MVICLGVTPVTLDAPIFSHRVLPHELLGRERVSLQLPASERPHGTTTEDAGYSERGPIWPWRALIFDRLVRSALVSQDVPLARWRHRGFADFDDFDRQNVFCLICLYVTMFSCCFWQCFIKWSQWSRCLYKALVEVQSIAQTNQLSGMMLFQFNPHLGELWRLDVFW